jgi:hypothetical protein
MARISAASLRKSPACRLAVRLAVLFFALRAVLPVGYMPDLGALGHGEVRIVICTGNGTQALLVDESGKPVASQENSEPHGAAGDCAFGMATAQAVALPPGMAGPARAGFADPRPAPARGNTLLPTSLGPPLGPRAPPVLLG